MYKTTAKHCLAVVLFLEKIGVRPIRDNEIFFGGGKEVREFKEFREIKEVRDVREPESLPKARKPLLKFP
jgi:hypothetical protein